MKEPDIVEETDFEDGVGNRQNQENKDEVLREATENVVKEPVNIVQIYATAILENSPC